MTRDLGTSPPVGGSADAGPPRGDGSGQVDLDPLARGGSLNVLGAAATAATNVALVVLVARGFHQATAGVFFTVVSVFMLAVVLARLGTQTGLVYFISRFRALGTPERIGHCLRVALPPVALVGVLLGVAGFVSAPWVADALFQGEGAAAAGYLRALCAFLPVAALSEALLAATRGYGTMRPSALVERIGRPITQLLLILVVVLLGSAALLPLAWAGPYLPAAVLAALALAPRWRRTTPPPVPHDTAGSAAVTEPPLARTFWRYTAPRAVVGIAQLGLQRIDIILVAAFLGAAQAAIYTAATRFLVVGQLAQQALTQAVQPQFAGLFAGSDHTRVRDLYRVSTSWLILLAWPIYLLFAVFAVPLMGIFGEEYGSGAAVVVVLSLTMLVATGCGAVDGVLSMSGRSTSTLVNTVLALVVNVGLDLVLIPKFGILGAAAGWTVALLVKNLLPLVQLAVTIRVHPYGAGSALAAVLAVVCFGALPLAAVYGTGGTAPTIAAAAVGATVYAVVCWRLRGRLRLDALAPVVRAVGPASGWRRRG